LIQSGETSFTGAPGGPHGPVGFDLDLTLIDSQPAILAAWAEVARETGTLIDLDSVTRRLGIKLEDEAAYWFPAGQRDAAADIYRRHYVRVGPQLTTRLPGAGEALAAVRAAGERAIIITAKHHVSVGPSLIAAGLEADDLYTHVYGPEKAAVLTRLGAAVYVGDAPADMGAAAAAGAHAVGVATGSFGAAELVAAGAEVVLNSLLEFPPWYAALRAGPG
jgi:phosphoglycolate phosphatase